MLLVLRLELLKFLRVFTFHMVFYFVFHFVILIAIDAFEELVTRAIVLLMPPQRWIGFVGLGTNFAGVSL